MEHLIKQSGFHICNSKSGLFLTVSYSRNTSNAHDAPKRSRSKELKTYTFLHGRNSPFTKFTMQKRRNQKTGNETGMKGGFPSLLTKAPRNEPQPPPDCFVLRSGEFAGHDGASTRRIGLRFLQQ